MNKPTYTNAIFFNPVQNQTTATPARSNRRDWWQRQYSNARRARMIIAPPNHPGQTLLFTARFSATVYGPCGTLP